MNTTVLWLVLLLIFFLALPHIDRILLHWWSLILSRKVLEIEDLDEWHIGLQSALAAGSDVLWQLETLEEIQATGRSDDAGRLLEWMRQVEESNER